VSTDCRTRAQHARKMQLYCAVEIGRRLTEAKALVLHGEWGQWLEESVDYSQTTAARLMQLFKEYGSKLLASPTEVDSSNFAALQNLGYTQALILLGIPEEERAEFITGLDIENMSTRELQKAIEEKKQALQEKDQALEDGKKALLERDQAQDARDKALEENDNLKERLEVKDKDIDKLNDQIHDLDLKSEGYKQKFEAEQKKVRDKQKELEEAIGTTPTATKIPEQEGDIEGEMTKVFILKHQESFITYRDQILRAFENLTRTLSELNRKDVDVKEKNRQAAHEMMKNLTKQLEEWPPRVTFTVIQ